jgi:hypothetical protein
VGSFPPPALGERRHRGLARRLIAVRRRAAFVIQQQRPHPGRTDRRGRRLHDAADDNSVGKHIVIVVAPLAGRARGCGALEGEIVFFHVSAPVPLGYAESGGCTERNKDPTQNKITRDPGDACEEERQADEQKKVARFIVHSRCRLEGAATRLPLPVRELMALNRMKPCPRGSTAGHLSGSDRAARCPTETRRRGKAAA